MEDYRCFCRRDVSALAAIREQPRVGCLLDDRRGHFKRDEHDRGQQTKAKDRESERDEFLGLTREITAAEQHHECVEYSL